MIGVIMSSSNLDMKMFASTGDSGFPIPHPSTCLYRRLLKLNTIVTDPSKFKTWRTRENRCEPS